LFGAQHAVDGLDAVGDLAGAGFLTDGGLDGGNRLAHHAVVVEQKAGPAVPNTLPQVDPGSGSDAGDVHARPADVLGRDPSPQVAPAIQVNGDLAQHGHVTHLGPLCRLWSGCRPFRVTGVSRSKVGALGHALEPADADASALR
jgi:hypothetical protein